MNPKLTDQTNGDKMMPDTLISSGECESAVHKMAKAVELGELGLKYNCKVYVTFDYQDSTRRTYRAWIKGDPIADWEAHEGSEREKLGLPAEDKTLDRMRQLEAHAYQEGFLAGVIAHSAVAEDPIPDYWVTRQYPNPKSK